MSWLYVCILLHEFWHEIDLDFFFLHIYNHKWVSHTFPGILRIYCTYRFGQKAELEFHLDQLFLVWYYIWWSHASEWLYPDIPLIIYIWLTPEYLHNDCILTPLSLSVFQMTTPGLFCMIYRRMRAVQITSTPASLMQVTLKD